MPILALFLFGIVQFGIAYDKQQSINSAAREGARLGALETSTLEEISDRAIGAYGASAAPGEEISVALSDADGNPAGSRTVDGGGGDSYTGVSDDATTMPCGGNPQSDFVLVVVATPFDLTIPFFGVQELTIDSEAQFRCE